MATLADLMVRVGVDGKGADKGVKELREKLDKAWDGIKKAAAVAGATAGAALTAGLIGAVNAEAAADKLIAQVGATGEQAAALGEAQGALWAAGWGQAKEDVNRALAAVITSVDGMRNASSADLQDVTEDVLALAETFELDVSRAAQVAGQMVKAGFVSDVQEGLDLLTVSLQRVPAAVRDDLIDAIDEYAPFMRTIGVTGQRAFQILIQAADKGMFGLDKTGDALKEFTIRATDMSTASAVAFDILGMSQEQMTARLLAGGETGAAAFDQIVQGLLAIKDPVDQSQAALALFGTPLEDLSVSEIPQFLETLSETSEQMGEAAGAADRLGDSLHDNAATKVEQFKRSVQSALVEQMAAAIPHLESAAGWLSQHRDLVVPLVAVLGTFAGIIYTIITITKIWTAVQLALNIAMSLNPIGLIIIGVMLLIAGILLLWHNSEGFRKFFIGLWDAIKNAALAVGRWFRDVLWEKWIKTAWDKIVTAGIGTLEWFKELPGKIGEFFRKITAFIANPFLRAFNKVSEFWNRTVGSLSWTVPDWIPFVGGRTVRAPRLPTLPILHDGGIVPGRGDVPIMAEGGEGVFTREQMRAIGEVGGAGSPQLVLRGDGTRLMQLLLQLLTEALRTDPAFRAAVREA